ncbi:DNA-binding MarR family transcriptional regulator [Devosia subaequoris]|uniref:DNA-binding MarR family transcriptional regulator n=1 Tax=Devosia subaequoris TaxID=395930 RepID=A0A7W6IJL7_9HYPH|nr:MarR family transcriptional regulator [Devosia subaequoris]MBB4050850.1 DNA-binding MarR family transcriptional regulator [Devosia subaequoris]MCP1208473.1 MarR family transcriptional regulator [Devosia subaequoris]
MEDRTKSALTAMRKILRATESNSKQLMRETGLTPSQLIFMQILDGEQEKTAGHVASRMGITQATTTALLQKLETSGMIQRRRGEKDRRQVLLSLTDKGQRVLAIAPDGVHAQFHKQFSGLKEWEQIMLIAALERVADMLGGDHPDAAAVIDHVAELAGEVPFEPE